ncbi:MAG: magnesium transporter [Pseudomonadota bacterium]|nr:magnesium transporter [Pseudomonadota bacterium]
MTIDSQEEINKILVEKSSVKLLKIKQLISNMSTSEIAHCIESSPPEQRQIIWSVIDVSIEGDVLGELGEEIQKDLLSEIDNDELSKLISDLELDEMVDIIQNLPESRMQFLLSSISAIDRDRIRLVLEYPEDSAGGLLNTDTISVQQDHTLDIVIKYLKSFEKLPKNTDKIFVVSKNNQFIGELMLSSILVADDLKTTVRELMQKTIDPIDINQTDREVAKLFKQQDLVSAPVINENRQLIGRITFDDVVDVIIEDADQNLLSMAGIAEDTFLPPGRAARRRIIWLGLNLLTAVIAALAINIFQDTISKAVYLAVLMPIVASMGGVAATQTLSIVLRGLTLEQITKSNLGWLFKRELAVSILNGIALSLLIGFATFLWFQNSILSILISVAMIINLISSVIAGVFVPIILRKLKHDPAIAGSVIVTTVTDVVGFVSFLGLAAVFLL